jgi:DNA-binding winged helix-turn-helix (wHTH) protein
LYRFDEFELDAQAFELRHAGTLLRVDALVLRLLLVLVRSAGRLVTKEELTEAVWDGRAIADNAITVSMARLRKTLGASRERTELIATVYGRGYRFTHSVTVAEPKEAVAPAAPLPALAEAPFVGRERVLQSLLESLGEASNGHGRACLLLGEPGIGKTRAVEQLEREVRGSPFNVVWGYCREAGDTPPLWPWLRLYREVTGNDWNDAVAGATEEPVSADPLVRHRIFETITRALTQASEQRPLLLVLEDLHRADAASIELLSHLLDEIARTRILIVATARWSRGAPPRPETHLPRVLGHRNSERLLLQRLQPEDVSKYVSVLVGDADGSLSRAIFEKSEGNPFFMVELARSLKSGDVRGAAALNVPATALELLRQRVQVLDPDARAVLEAAAVIGRSFELPLLATILESDPSELMPAIDRAIAEEIVIAAPESMTAFAFGHELQRTVLYDALAPRDQRALHLRIADVLGKRLDQGEPIPPSELAFHSHAALPDGDLRATVQRCRAAANVAAAAFAIPDVVRYARHALEALDLIHGASVRLRMSLLYQISAYSRGHSWLDEERSSRELARLAREHGDGPMLARASSILNIHPELKPLHGANEAAELALELLPADNLALRGMAMAQLACSAPRCYVRSVSGPLIEEATELARHSGDRNSIIPVLTWRMHLEGGPDSGHAAPICAELEALMVHGTREMPVMPMMLAFFHATVALQRGQLAAAESALSHAESIACYLNHAELSWHIRRCRAVGRINRGELADGRAKLAQLHREIEHTGLGTALPLCAFDRVMLLERTDEAAENAQLARELEVDPSEPPSLWALKVRGLARAGLVDHARAALRRVAPSALAELPCDSQYLGTLGHLTRAVLELGVTEYLEALRALLERYPTYFSAQLSFVCEGSMPALLGRVLRALGREEEAVVQLERGAEAEERAGLVSAAQETRGLLT